MTTLPLLLEPEFLAELLPVSSDLVVIEQATLEQYQAGHIPGSIWVDFKAFQAKTPPPGEAPTEAELSELLGSLGIDATTHVVCSDDEGGGWAGRLIWLLESIGHRHYSLLNGGLTAWKAAALPVTQDVSKAVARQYSVVFNEAESIQQAEILAKIGQPDFVIWDARSVAEYRGEMAVSQRGGHIPGAVHYEWTQLMDKTRGLRLRPLEDIRSELKSLGIESGKLVVTHCQSHHRSGLTYVVGKLLGLNIKAYPGSWSQWGNQPDTPIHTSF